jgi:hypothetical protein
MWGKMEEREEKKWKRKGILVDRRYVKCDGKR